MKKNPTPLVLLVSFLSASALFAENENPEMRNKNCPGQMMCDSKMSSSPIGRNPEGCQRMQRDSEGIEFMILGKFHKIMKQRENLNISDDQFEKIKELKHKTMKELIKKKAELDVLEIDLQDKFSSDEIDKQALEKLTDQKFDIKKSRTKILINALSELQDLLTTDQKSMLKNSKRPCEKK